MKRRQPIKWSLVFILLVVLTRRAYTQEGQDTPSFNVGDDPKFTHLTPNEGLSSEYVSAIVQDSQGFMWFGTESGLNRYDGYEFVVYRHDPDDPQSSSISGINTLYKDHTGALWVGTLNGLHRFDRATQTFDHYLHAPDDARSLSNNRVRVVVEDGDGTMWVATLDGGLNRFDSETETFTRFRHDDQDLRSLSNDHVWALHIDRQGALWVGTAEGLDRFDPETETFGHYRHALDDAHSLGAGTVRAIYESRDGALWVGTDRDGLSRFDRETETFTHYRHDPAVPQSLGDNTVFCIYETRDGVLWIGTNNGLNRFDSATETFTIYRPGPDNPDSMNDPAVISLAQDRAGALWIGTMSGGVNKLDPVATKFIHYRHQPNDPHSLNSNQVRGVLEGEQGYVWIGTIGGGLNRFDPATGEFKAYMPNPESAHSSSSAVVTWLDQDHGGALWVGTWGDGICRFAPGTETFTCYRYDAKDPRSLGGDLILTVRVDEHDTVWVGTWGGGLSRFDRESETFVRYRYDENEPASLGDNRVHDLLVDNAGTLWVGLVGRGLDRFDPESETFVHYPIQASDSGNPLNLTVLDVYQDRSGAIWLGTTIGLYRLDHDSGTFHLYTEKDGMPTHIVRCIQEDDATPPNLWLGTNNGLYRFDPRAGSSRRYDVRDGLQDISFSPSACEKSSTGELFFGGNNGLNRFDPAQLTDNAYIPPVVLTDFRLFHEPVSIGGDSALPVSIDQLGELVLSHDQNVFSLEFAALSYTAPEKNHYAYRMDGVDRDWVYVDGNRRFATYTNLEPGAYTFRVIGSNNDGVWNEQGATLDITITPPWWDTFGFKLLLAVAGIGALVGVVYGRTYAIQQRNRRLETEVARRTIELAESERRYRLLAENAEDVIWTVDHDLNFTYISPAIKKLRGFTPAEAMQECVPETMTPESYRIVKEAGRRHVEADQAGDRNYFSRFEIEQYCQDGSTVWVECVTKTLFDGAGVQLGRLGVSRDITEHKQARTALRASENRFATVMHSIEGAMYVADMETFEILFINHYTRNVFGDVEGQICWQALQTGQTGPCDFCTNARLAVDGEPTGLYTWEFRNTITGHWYYIQDQAIRWVDGRLVRLEVATDITEFKQAEAKLRAQQRRVAILEERERIGQELHDDLGQVMSYISLQAQTARTLLGQGEQTQAETLLAKLAQVAQNTHADLRKYILGIRDTAGTPDFFATLENYLALLRERYGLDIEMEVPDDLLDAPFGPQVEWQLLRIIQEAVTNVGKHAGVDSAQLTFQPQDKWMTVTIRDAGRGFALHAPREREHFGLEMMRERAASIGGRLEIHSDLEQGARVTAHVPLYPLFLQKEDDWADTRGLRVMLADDHALFLEGLSTMLAARGVQVVGTARDGLEAETLALQLRPDVILMDVQMPRCDGVMATRRILTQLTTVKIVMLTVAADDDTLFAALKAGASGYLLKSLDSVTLFNLLAELMRDQVVLAPGLAARVLTEFSGGMPASLDKADEPPAPLVEKGVGAMGDEPLVTTLAQSLTPRQVEVLRLISQGITYKEVGAALYISERTVKYHMGQILKRLQLKSRAQAIAHAMQEGLIEE